MRRFLILMLFIVLVLQGIAGLPPDKDPKLRKSTTLARSVALSMIDDLQGLNASEYWPAIDPELFVRNLRLNVTTPDSIHQGNRTNFCGYAVVTYLYAQMDPVGYVTDMLELYKRGELHLKNQKVAVPPPAIRRAAGTLQNKGVLVSRPADQMWFLTLAAHFRGFINVFNRWFDKGDENRLWAAMEQGKLNRLLQSIFYGDLRSKGKGIIINSNSNMAGSIMQYLNTSSGTVILYADETFRTKGEKKHWVPHHYLVIEDLKLRGDKYQITYWDYGAVKQLALKKKIFERAARGYTTLDLNPMAYNQTDPAQSIGPAR